MTDTVTVTIDGEARSVPAFTTVAAALAMHGALATRLSVTGEPRGPLCGMGVCQECRVSVDGRAHVLACQTLCRDGLAISTATGTAR
ncbi:(2Fe-2S)-binding protein [Caballeronia telluris]|jgi:predicted molibdopterin-dependent oxidoreductase YjgC|uniref:NAD-dependent formate dehydrogenase subunit alpha n=1 Tax=Caballeronia telluris TaxID=326475 RepID=A0A158G2Q5_9BURK|nr:(2Fe-2S)-binding protein [Caballeronia telluris]SAL26365.1 NAD-dependent formate dehydrogenase subunit alpha [Caballeronia telluris]